jgi:hypothetical protein
LEGQPISVARARLLACEAGVIPSVFNYTSGEAVELGRAMRLPNAALRRKLELEQPEGCAWHGCDRPVAWTEAHHIQHWADGGPTAAENLILLCRFHHGRIHTAGWTVEKTGPGTAVITHHDSHQGQGGNDNQACGCSDWRTDHDMDTEHQGTDWDVFPTGLYRTEWSETLKPDLDALAEAIDRDRAIKAMRAAKARCREKFKTPTPTPTPPTPVPVLGCPSGPPLGASAATHHTMQRSPTPARVRAPQHAQARKPAPTNHFQSLPARTPNRSDRKAGTRPQPRHCLVDSRRPNPEPLRPECRRPARALSLPRHRRPIELGPNQTRQTLMRPEPRYHLGRSNWRTDRDMDAERTA